MPSRTRIACQTLVLITCTIFLISGCSPYRCFYYPNKKLYVDPEQMHLDYDMMQYTSLNGKKLFALLFRTKQEPKGIVAHFHGNFGNVSNHFMAATFLLDHGFDVLVFDYQGYGGSEGTPSPERTIEDGVATIQYAATLNRNPKGGVVILGQSLGGAVAIAAMAREPLARAAVIEASFPSYRTMAFVVLKRSVLTWPVFLVYPWLINHKYDPVRFLSKIPPRPLFFIHGTGDRVVPVKMSKILFAKASEPKSLWIVEGADHMEVRQKDPKVYDQKVSDFFTDALFPPTNKAADPANPPRTNSGAPR